MSKNDPHDFRVRLVPEGTPSKDHSHLIWDGYGHLKPESGYKWKHPNDPNKLGVEFAPGSPFEGHPNVIFASPNKVQPLPGYHWLSDAPASSGDYRVELNRGLISESNGSFHPAPAYEWLSEDSTDLRVRLRPGLVEVGGGARPASGYRWLHEDDPNDFRVVTITEASKRLSDAIEAAADSPGCVGSMTCNFFVGGVAEQLQIPYFRDVLTAKNPDGYVANSMYIFISNAIMNPRSSGWVPVSASEAQELANNGRFVVGVARNVEPSSENHGHIVIVTPDYQDHASEQGAGPWVRDGQNPKISRRASKRFGDDVVEPIYAAWNGPM